MPKQNNPDTFKYQVEANNKTIILEIPASNGGKFRFKTRTTKIEFGNTFSTRKKIFDDTVYLEWQIGYDSVVYDVLNKKKFTSLTKFTFEGANQKSKYLYELSELLFQTIKIGLVSIDNIIQLLEEIEKYTELIEDNKIEVEHRSSIILNGIHFEEAIIKLPTLYMIESIDNTQVEVSIQKQQYASGVQPMVYFCIPIKAFNNYNDFIGRSSKKGDILIYEINENNSKILFDIMKIFAMCSKSHNHDIKEILKILIKLAKS